MCVLSRVCVCALTLANMNCKDPQSYDTRSLSAGHARGNDCALLLYYY